MAELYGLNHLVRECAVDAVPNARHMVNIVLGSADRQGSAHDVPNQAIYLSIAPKGETKKRELVLHATERKDIARLTHCVQSVLRDDERAKQAFENRPCRCAMIQSATLEAVAQMSSYDGSSLVEFYTTNGKRRMTG